MSKNESKRHIGWLTYQLTMAVMMLSTIGILMFYTYGQPWYLGLLYSFIGYLFLFIVTSAITKLSGRRVFKDKLHMKRKLLVGLVIAPAAFALSFIGFTTFLLTGNDVVVLNTTGFTITWLSLGVWIGLAILIRAIPYMVIRS